MTAQKWAEERAREIACVAFLCPPGKIPYGNRPPVKTHTGVCNRLTETIAAALVEAEARGFESRMAAAEEFVRNEVKGRAVDLAELVAAAEGVASRWVPMHTDWRRLDAALKPFREEKPR